MVARKQLLSEKLASAKKEKNQFNKNNSFSGVELKKSPKSRRKSIAAVLPTPLKKKKKPKNFNGWIVSESISEDPIVKKEQVVISFSSEEEDEGKITLETPKPKVKKLKTSVHVSKVKKSAPELLQTPSSAKKQKTKALSEEKLNGSSEVDETENKFGIEAKDVAKAVKAVIKLHKENPKLQNQLFDDLIPLSLQVSCHKLPVGPPRVIRIPLPNTLVTPDDEICLIVPELKGVKNVEHEKHVEHYENLLRIKGVENIKKIMTFHEFRTEYETFEQKLRLVDLYDYFLVDGRISGKVVKKCGKIFYKKRKLPTAVKLQATKLKEHIDKSLSKAFFHLHLKGTSFMVKFGHDKLTTQDLVDNVFAVIESLNKEFPGGFQNIKGLHVTTVRATSIPIYSSFKSPQSVKNPKIKAKRTKVYKTYTGELTTKLNTEVTVKPTGEVIVMTIKDNENTTQKENNAEEVKTKSKKNRKRKQSEIDSTEGVKKSGASTDDNSIKKKKLKTAVIDENVSKVNSSDNVTKKKKRNKNKESSDVEQVFKGANENQLKKIKKRRQSEDAEKQHRSNENVQENSEINLNGAVKPKKRAIQNGTENIKVSSDKRKLEKNKKINKALEKIIKKEGSVTPLLLDKKQKKSKV